MKVTELAGRLEVYISQLLKVREEVVNHIDELNAQLSALQEALENVTVPEAASAALASLGATIQSLDDLHEDAVVPEEPPVE